MENELWLIGVPTLDVPTVAAAIAVACLVATALIVGLAVAIAAPDILGAMAAVGRGIRCGIRSAAARINLRGR